MRKKYKYDLVQFSRDGKFSTVVLESFLLCEKARKRRFELLKNLNSNFSIRIDRTVRSIKVFKQSTIYDFIGV